MQKNHQFCLLISTCNDAEEAEKIAKQLVSKQLSACVNIIDGVKSVYQWQQNMEVEQEYLLVIKTKYNLIEQVEMTLKQIHTYELPELITVPIESGSNAYLNWLSENLK